MKRFLHLTDAISERLGAVNYLLLVLTGLLLYEVGARYFFNNPTIWSYDVSLFLYGGIGILLGSHVLLHDQHIRMDIIYRRLSPRGRAVIDSVTAILFFAFIILLIWKGGEFALYSFQLKERSGTSWHALLYPIKMVIPVAAFLVLLQGIAKFIRDLFFAIRGRQLS